MTVYNSGMNERWTIEQLAPLVEMALDLSGYNGQHSGRIRSLPDLRTIRYYTTLGLLDPPAEMRGRKAFYGRRHLVQLVAIKRLQSRGLSLAEVQQALAGLDDRALAELAALPADFWQRATARRETSADSVRLESLTYRERSATPSGQPSRQCRRADPAEQPPLPRLALHLPVIDGVELVLEGIDPARWTPEALARLKGPLEAIAQTLRELDLYIVNQWKVRNPMQQVKSLEEEVAAGASAASEGTGFGLLKTERGGLPLVAMDVRARISGLTAQVRVRQTYRNALSEALEATYIFPLPDRAAVTAFRMEVAGRIVEGDLKERGAAREEYEKAIEAGHRAAIAEEERSGTFSLRVGNIPAKEQVTIELTLVGPVAVADGEATFRFPLVVAPRYVPGVPLDGPPVGAGWGPDTDQAPDASRVTPPVLLPGFPNPVRLSLEVEIDPAGLGPEDGDWAERIRASLHSVVVEQGPPWTVRLQPGELLDRDFILRFPVAGESLQATLLCSPPRRRSARHVRPDARTAGDRRAGPAPRDVVIVLDRSGSMQGWKMVAARRAVGRMIDTLLDQDRFTVLAFDNSIEYPPHADKQLAAGQRSEPLAGLGVAGQDRGPRRDGDGPRGGRGRAAAPIEAARPAGGCGADHRRPGGGRRQHPAVD